MLVSCLSLPFILFSVVLSRLPLPLIISGHDLRLVLARIPLCYVDLVSSYLQIF